MASLFDQPVDKQALTLAHAIALQESGGGTGNPNYNAVGDNGTSHGAYQWQPGNFESAAKAAGLDPTDRSPQNQDKVAYYQVKSYKDKGYDPGQIASLWNSGSPNNWKNHSGTTIINGKPLSYDTPAYVKGVQAYYQKLAATQPQSDGGTYNPKPFSNPSGTTGGNSGPGTFDFSGTGGDTTAIPQGPATTGGEISDLAKKAGNFLFPIAGDIYHDIKGDSSKTALQQAGDAGLSALPFIPGLGEAGEAARGVEAAGEGAAAAAKGTGLASKILGSAVTKNAAVGYGAGVAANLSQGQGVGQALTPQLSNIGGAVLGGATPKILEGAGGIINKIAGVSPQMANDLAKIGANDTKGFDKYVAAAQQRTKTSMAPSAINVAASDADAAAQKIKSMLQASGTRVGAANRAAESVPMDAKAVQSVADDFNQRLEDGFGVKVQVNDSGTGLELSPTRRGGVALSPTEQSRVLDVAHRLNSLGTKGNVREADDLMTTLDKKIDYGVTGRDPLTGLFAETRHAVNDAARKVAPEFAAANDESAGLHKLLSETEAMAGKDTQRGELLMRRVFTGDKGQEVQELFDKIKAATGIDLTKSALFAKYATEIYGNQDDKTLLEKIIGNAVAAHTGGIPILSGALRMAGGAAKSTIANPVKIGKRLINGKSTVGPLTKYGAYLTARELPRAGGLVKTAIVR